MFYPANAKIIKAFVGGGSGKNALSFLGIEALAKQKPGSRPRSPWLSYYKISSLCISYCQSSIAE